MLRVFVRRALLILLGALVCALGGTPAAWAQTVQPVPALTGRVVDTTGTLDAAQSGALVAKLESLERIHGAQLVVLIVPTTAPEDIASYALRVGESWKVGRRAVGDGVVVVVAKNDRKVRIEVAKGLEGAIPDVAADRIIRAAITPAFKVGDYAGGLNRAIDALSARIQADGSPRPASAPLDDPSASANPGEASSSPVPTRRADVQGAPRADAANGASSGAPMDPGAAISTGGLGLAIFVASVLLCLKFGRKGGAIGAGGLAAAASGVATGSIVFALVTGLLVLVLVMLFGQGSRPSARDGRSSSSSVLGDIGQAILWGAASSRGGWGGGLSSGGGFRSGRGGDFGGGGASGDW